MIHNHKYRQNYLLLLKNRINTSLLEIVIMNSHFYIQLIFQEGYELWQWWLERCWK